LYRHTERQAERERGREGGRDLCQAVVDLGAGADDRAAIPRRAVGQELPVSSHAPDAGVSEAVDGGIERAELLAEERRQHGYTAGHKVDRGGAAPCLDVKGAAGSDEPGDVGDVDADLEVGGQSGAVAAADSSGGDAGAVQGVVEVLGRGGVDGEYALCLAQVASHCDLGLWYLPHTPGGVCLKLPNAVQRRRRELTCTCTCTCINAAYS